MTPYHERREQGHYEAGTIRTQRVEGRERAAKPTQLPAEPEPEVSEEPSEEWTLNELKARATSMELPDYGSKAQLVERIKSAEAIDEAFEGGEEE
jgi:hypothetical protein